MSDAPYSPLFEQYFAMKERYADAILLSRVGDFYEAYGEDAQTIAAALQIALTSKEAGGGRRVAMAGVPYHALDGYLAKLVAQQRVVALAEQLDAPVPNKLVQRDVKRVVTPGTLIEENLLARERDNYLVALTTGGDALALAYADVSTGRAAATAYSGDSAFDETLAELTRLSPAEIVADVPPEMRAQISAHVPGVRVTVPPLAAVVTVAGVGLDGFSLDEAHAMRRALGALRAFVKRVGFEAPEGALREPEFYRARTFVALDANTRRHLDLLTSQGANPKATLLATIDRCKTAMGSRLLGRWLTAPLIEARAIAARAERVAALVADYPARASLQELLGGAFDLERITQKVRFRRALPRDLGSLRRTLALLEPLRAALPAPLASYRERIGDHRALAAELQATLCDDLPATLADGGVIRPDASGEVEQCIAARAQARERMAKLEERERERTGIKGLRVKYASAFGYAIEVSKSNLAHVPADYVRKQTLTSGERFIIPELKELELAVGSAQAQQLRLEETLYADLVETVAQSVDALLATADALAELDVACSLAQTAAERGYVRPQFGENSSVDVVDGRHPVMEAVADTPFVPNDVHLAEEAARFVLLTGPNMGGKSTYLRQTALLVILAQIGSFVPARSMTLGVVDRIFTRIGAGDDLASGQSTFYVEMSEASNILRRCTRRSLLLIDEVGRGTGTIDGLAIAQAICEYLLGLDGQAPLTLFATHFHELVALAERWPLVANFHVTAVENTLRAGAPVFSHRVLPGSTSRSFGIEVAKMAGLPGGVIARAKEIAAALDQRPTLEGQVPLRTRLAAPSGREEMQLALEL
ncbi:MAG: DNA mismatch repair protein MutS [Candidatus Eremiobacteraeota bacterium]|nr:DNA mismatch repair protein MutS [Candidatus Eremiobacteraeota bacterium]MBC5801635.1 DNA mismatch repair protein MutS [Candidatus Eremiobacteraeota bacterium]MBC5822457.1 DNA mismatch repair protein MutS [Candidatus Eremiobacteraeota bacterium]